MAAKITTVTFEIDAQHHKDGQFSIPKKVCDLLEIQNGGKIALIIKSSSGTKEFIKKLSSGTEIYGADISQCVKAGEKITVTASNPEHSQPA